MVPVRLRCARPVASRSGGFTLIELMVVVALVGLLATLGLNALTGTKPRQAISLAPKQFAAAIDSARSYAQSTGRDVVLLTLGTKGAEVAAQCEGGMTDTNCIRYWILEDVGTAPADRFGTTHRTGFDPTAIKSQAVTGRGQLQVTADGDYVLETGYLPKYVYFGRHAAFTVPVIPATSALAGLPVSTTACSACSGTPPRASLTFSPEGELRGGATGGELFYLTAVEGNGQPLGDTRAVAVLRPSGMVLDRIFRSQ